MEARFQNLREQGSKAKKSSPLVLEEFEWDNEWVDINTEMVHEDQAQVMDGETPLLWSQVDEAMGASTSLAGRNNPRRARGDPIARPIGPYITYTRNNARTRLVVHDEELRAELEAAEYDKDMESSDEDDAESIRVPCRPNRVQRPRIEPAMARSTGGCGSLSFFLPRR